jgi:hypothetical protein
MQHESEDANPTTHREPEDVETHGPGSKKIPHAEADVEAHNWAGKPPIVDDVQAHVSEPPDAAEPAGGGS